MQCSNKAIACQRSSVHNVDKDIFITSFALKVYTGPKFEKNKKDKTIIIASGYDAIS